MRSTSSTLAVSMMIGVVSLLARRRRQIDRPSSPGSIRSSTIRSIVSRVITRFRALESSASRTSKPFLGEVASQQVADTGVIVDHDHTVGSLIGGGIHSASPPSFVTAAL
jgi:hypothetical protein